VDALIDYLLKLEKGLQHAAATRADEVDLEVGHHAAGAD
jgi:hypothetical protein